MDDWPTRARSAARAVAALAVVLGIALVAWTPRPPRAAETESAPGADHAAADDTDTEGAAQAEPTSPARPPHKSVVLRGRVVWLAEALEDLYGIPSDDDVAHTQVAMRTAEGQLYPIVKDARGRGFMIDPRLREMDLELLVRIYEGSPVVQVIRVYSRHDGEKYELDYWCDVCAIRMYELKPCECCQGPIRLRERRVGDTKPLNATPQASETRNTHEPPQAE